MAHSIYAIGDIHGRSDLLNATLDFIEQDARQRDLVPKVVFLGDIIDRGHSPRRCLEMVQETLTRWPLSVFLLGNHDRYLRRAFDDAPDANSLFNWIRNGGAITLSDFGIDLDIPTDRPPQEIYSDLAVLVSKELNARHSETLNFLRKAKLYEVEAPYLFVHAGIRPGVPLEQQTEEDLLKIRKGFTDHFEPLPFVVVHGHSVVEYPHVWPNRIAVDTEAWDSDLLTTAVFAPGIDPEFYGTDGDAIRPIEPVRHTEGALLLA
jgi:serine/threonine protein phosphatase 1